MHGTCFGCEIQTVYSYLNRTEITENRHQKLKPNRTGKNLNRGSLRNLVGKFNGKGIFSRTSLVFYFKGAMAFILRSI